MKYERFRTGNEKVLDIVGGIWPIDSHVPVTAVAGCLTLAVTAPDRAHPFRYPALSANNKLEVTDSLVVITIPPPRERAITPTEVEADFAWTASSGEVNVHTKARKEIMRILLLNICIRIMLPKKNDNDFDVGGRGPGMPSFTSAKLQAGLLSGTDFFRSPRHDPRHTPLCPMVFYYGLLASAATLVSGIIPHKETKGPINQRQTLLSGIGASHPRVPFKAYY